MSALGSVGRYLRGLFGRFTRSRTDVPTRWRWAYRCTWYDNDTGRETGQVYVEVFTPIGGSYQLAGAEARRAANASIREKGTPNPAKIGNSRMRCRRAQAPVAVP